MKLSRPASPPIRTAIFTALALTAFASNSILSRVALREGAIDAGAFTAIRLVSGALILCLLVWATHKRVPFGLGGSWTSATMLFLYALAFSLAYVSLSAGSGALILFGSVQATMLLWGILRGERPGILQWLGLSIAICGLVYLVLPGISAPPLWGALLMSVAGIAWGVYSLRGSGITDSAAATADNFIRSAPLGILAALALFEGIRLTPVGVFWAFLSGAVTSGLGYVAWYAALRGLSSTKAAIVQLCVPLLAAFGGVVLLSETATMRLLLASGLILGGVALALSSRASARRD